MGGDFWPQPAAFENREWNNIHVNTGVHIHV